MQQQAINESQFMHAAVNVQLRTTCIVRSMIYVLSSCNSPVALLFMTSINVLTSLKPSALTSCSSPEGSVWSRYAPSPDCVGRGLLAAWINWANCSKELSISPLLAEWSGASAFLAGFRGKIEDLRFSYKTIWFSVASTKETTCSL